MKETTGDSGNMTGHYDHEHMMQVAERPSHAHGQMDHSSHIGKEEHMNHE